MQISVRRLGSDRNVLCIFIVWLQVLSYVSSEFLGCPKGFSLIFANIFVSHSA